MTELTVITKGGARPEGKPRVYFTCHPADLARSLERLCGDLFAAADCAVYRRLDMADRLPEETGETDLERMNLFVIPVSLKLLTEPSLAMDEDFPFAREKHIPVLPIMLEPGLDPVYGRKDRFGELQYLDPTLADPTAIPYEEKLKKYLDSVLLDSGTAERIRKAFDAYIFLSYRKKDRKQANELMRIIHADPACRDVAVWFDEFLTPGESFRETIREALWKSKAFALLVTPNLLERNDRGEPNFVQATEYPMGREAGLPLLPAEVAVENRLADRDDLFRAFQGLPMPLNVTAEAERERFLSRLRALAREENDDDPAHNYLIGLAYLEGIDVEVDRARGLALITAAAEGELPEAVERLCRMYEEGDGVPLDYRKAVFWREKLAAFYRRVLGEEHPDTRTALGNLALAYCGLGDYRKALELQEKVWALERSALGEEHPDTLTTLSNLASTYQDLGDYRKALELKEKVCALERSALGEEHPDTLTALNNLATTYGYLGDYRKALELMEKVWMLRRRVLGEEHLQTLASLNNLAATYVNLGDYRKALELMEKVCALQSRVLGEEHPDNLAALNNLAETYWFGGERQKALELLEKVWALRRRVLGEEHPDTLASLGNLASTYRDLGDGRKALELMKKVCALQSRVLREEHPQTLASLNNLAVTYVNLGDYRKALELMEKVCALQSRVLGEEHPDTLISLSNLAATYAKLGDYRKALELQEKAWTLLCRTLGEKHPYSMASLNALAEIYQKLGEKDKEAAAREKLRSLRQ